MKSRSIISYLLLSGLILITIGAYISLTPTAYLAQFDLEVVDSTNFYSDLRAMGGCLVVFGLLALWGVFHLPVRPFSLLTTSIIFSTYVVFRIVAFIMDGFPGSMILLATAIEIVFAATGWYLSVYKMGNIFSFEASGGANPIIRDSGVTKL